MGIRLRRKRLALMLTGLMLVQTGCGGLAKPPIPSLENPDFRKQLAGSVHLESAPSDLMAGMAKRDITPPVGTPLGGYGRRKGRPSQGVHDPLQVRVITLKDRTDFLVFASCDLVAIDQELYQAVLQKVASHGPLVKPQLFLSATHTHSGSGGIGKRFLERIISGRYRADVFCMTVDRISEAILEAVNDMKPAAIGLGSTRLDGMIENRMIDGGEVDDSLSVLKIQPENGPPGFLVNLAAHPTVLNAENFFFSADFPGFLEQAVEKKFPGAVCLFTNGAAGDQRIHGFSETQGFNRAEAIGGKLAGIVLKTAGQIRLEKQAAIITLQTPLCLPPVKIRYEFLRPPSFLGNRLIDRHVVCNAARLNDMVFLSIPGEMTGGLGLEIKKEAERMGLKPVILGYTNGYIGYIIPEKYYSAKTYESSVTFFGPQLDRYFLQAALAQIHFLKEVEHEAAA